MPSLSALPNELWERTISHLYLPDLSNFAQTSRRSMANSRPALAKHTALRSEASYGILDIIPGGTDKDEPTSADSSWERLIMTLRDPVMSYYHRSLHAFVYYDFMSSSSRPWQPSEDEKALVRDAIKRCPFIRHDEEPSWIEHTVLRGETDYIVLLIILHLPRLSSLCINRRTPPPPHTSDLWYTIFARIAIAQEGGIGPVHRRLWKIEAKNGHTMKEEVLHEMAEFDLRVLRANLRRALRENEFAARLRVGSEEMPLRRLRCVSGENDGRGEEWWEDLKCRRSCCLGML